MVLERKDLLTEMVMPALTTLLPRPPWADNINQGDYSLLGVDEKHSYHPYLSQCGQLLPTNFLCHT